jgi:hypothetical protein
MNHVACFQRGISPIFGGNSEWAYETGYIVSPFDLGDYTAESFAVRLRKADPEHSPVDWCPPQGFEPRTNRL